MFLEQSDDYGFLSLRLETNQPYLLKMHPSTHAASHTSARRLRQDQQHLAPGRLGGGRRGDTPGSGGSGVGASLADLCLSWVMPFSELCLLSNHPRSSSIEGAQVG